MELNAAFFWTQLSTRLWASHNHMRRTQMEEAEALLGRDIHKGGVFPAGI
jgi:hypothetical protein